MIVVYIAHPLSGDWAGNIAAARQFVLAAARLGVAPVAPYLELDGLLDDAIAGDRELGLAIDLALINVVDELWACGPRISSGMALEVAEAERLGIRVRRFETVAELAEEAV